MTYASGCKCHGATFCPDMVCVDMSDDDVPIFARRDSPEGVAAIKRMDEIERRRDREEFDRLQAKYGWR